MPTPVTVRAAVEADHARVDALTLAANAGLVSDLYLPQLGDVAGRVGDAEVLVAELDGRVVGSVTWTPDGPLAQVARPPAEASFRMLAVDPAAQGHGVGRALVAACVERARSLGCERVVISTGERMTSAHALYASLGFRRAPERDWDVRDGTRLRVLELDL